MKLNNIKYNTNENLQVLKYDTSKFKFKEILENHMKKITTISKLELLHLYIPKEKMPTDPIEGTAHTWGHDLLYAVDSGFRQNEKIEMSNTGFINLYKEFIKYLRDDYFEFDIIYQSKPSLRIHYPEYTSYGIFHTDSEYNHPNSEINIWMPITETKNTASMWIEQSIGKKDYKPVNMNFGEMLIFNSKLMHGNKVNEENYTRISMDFRVIPKKLYKSNNKNSVTQGTKFEIGSYYSDE